MMLTYFAIIQTLFVSVSGWNKPSGLDNEINKQIEVLENSLDLQKQDLNIKDIKFISEHKAFILFEIVDKT